MKRLIPLVLACCLLTACHGDSSASGAGSSSEELRKYTSSSESTTVKSGISLDTLGYSLLVGDELQVDLNITGHVKVTYTIGDPSIASVDSKGKVKALKPGVTYLSCSTSEQEVTCSIIVNEG